MNTQFGISQVRPEIVTQDNEMGNIGSSLQFLLKFDIPREAKILDIGCNYGSLIYNLHMFGYENAYGVEIDQNAVSKGKLVYPDIADRLSVHQPGSLPFESMSFDVVLMFDVIEHVPDVKVFIRNEVNRVMKDKGKFIFQTPNKLINVPWEIINQRSLTKWKSYHKSLQTPNSLKKLLENTGFGDIHLEKGDILSEHNKIKVRKKIGSIGTPLLALLQTFPLTIYPNIWGSAHSKKGNKTNYAK